MEKKTRNPQKTRQRLLQSASEEIHKHGFQGMRVDEVLRKAGLQKGAFYHHFSSKVDLGYAVLEEQVNPLLETIWIEPLKSIKNPITDFPKMLEQLFKDIPSNMLEHGCPLNNLAQEMASQDAGFQERVVILFDNWITAYTQLFEEAQANGHVQKDINAEDIARFLVAILEGCISIFKAEQSPAQWQACQSQIKVYLHAIKT